MHPRPMEWFFWAPNLRLGHRWATGASINPSLKSLWIEEIATFMCLGNLKGSEGCPLRCPRKLVKGLVGGL